VKVEGTPFNNVLDNKYEINKVMLMLSKTISVTDKAGIIPLANELEVTAKNAEAIVMSVGNAQPYKEQQNMLIRIQLQYH